MLKLTRKRVKALNIDINQVAPTFIYALNEANAHIATMANDDDDVDNTNTDYVNSALIKNLHHSKFLELAIKRLNSFSGRVGNEILLFFDDFESLAKASNISDTVKLGTLPLFLDSFPQSIVNSLRTESYADAKRF